MIGYTCAYTPLALIHAAGFTPKRLLPMGDWPDRAGQMLHESLCPHVKRVLDQALEDDLPLTGMVFINSCDAMRRLSDVWQKARPDDTVYTLDLPASMDDNSVSYFSYELSRFATALNNGVKMDALKIEESLVKYNRLSSLLEKLKKKLMGRINGFQRLQEIYNMAAGEDVEKSMEHIETLLASPVKSDEDTESVPVFLFGNVLPDPRVFTLLQESGARIADADLCTGERQFARIPGDSSTGVYQRIAKGILSRIPCARTIDAANPLALGDLLLARATEAKARGVITHTLKFCDPYLGRMPLVREKLKEAGLPLLVLEGDCTLGSMGQHKTRIEAFIEMLR